MQILTDVRGQALSIAIVSDFNILCSSLDGHLTGKSAKKTQSWRGEKLGGGKAGETLIGILQHTYIHK